MNLADPDGNYSGKLPDGKNYFDDKYCKWEGYFVDYASYYAWFCKPTKASDFSQNWLGLWYLPASQPWPPSDAIIISRQKGFKPRKDPRNNPNNRGPDPNAPGKNEAHGPPGEKENHSQRPKGNPGVRRFEITLPKIDWGQVGLYVGGGFVFVGGIIYLFETGDSSMLDKGAKILAGG